MKIIVAEDDAVSRERLCNSLFVLGHEVQAYTNGREALEGFLASPSSVIISDWIMPELDGIEFCRALRDEHAKAFVYFILVTAKSANAADYDEAAVAGVDDFLVKPLDSDEISRRLRVAERVLRYTSQIRRLTDLIPICMYCKKIRTDGDYWQSIENFIHEHTGSDFSHGICPDCYDHYSAGPQRTES
ncbi:MAG: response regulator [Verrucomicrobiota bacterium]